MHLTPKLMLNLEMETYTSLLLQLTLSSTLMGVNILHYCDYNLIIQISIFYHKYYLLKVKVSLKRKIELNHQHKTTSK